MGVEGGCGREGEHFNGAVKRRIVVSAHVTAILTPRAPVRLRQDGEMPSHALGFPGLVQRCHVATEMLALPTRRGGEVNKWSGGARSMRAIEDQQASLLGLNGGRCRTWSRVDVAAFFGGEGRQECRRIPPSTLIKA